MNDTTHVAALVPVSIAMPSSVLLLVERISWPGAKISIFSPKLQNGAKASSMVVAPTVMAPATRAGELLFAS